MLDLLRALTDHRVVITGCSGTSAVKFLVFVEVDLHCVHQHEALKSKMKYYTVIYNDSVD